MNLIAIDRNPSMRQLGLFGLLWFLALGLLARFAWRAWSQPWLAAGLLGLAILIPAAGALRREVLRFTYVAMTVISAPIGFVVSFVVLASVYYLVLTPIGLLLRAGGRLPMARGVDRAATSYWAVRARDERPERYFHPF